MCDRLTLPMPHGKFATARQPIPLAQHFYHEEAAGAITPWNGRYRQTAAPANIESFNEDAVCHRYCLDTLAYFRGTRGAIFSGHARYVTATCEALRIERRLKGDLNDEHGHHQGREHQRR